MGIIDNSVTRYPNGVTNVADNNIFNALKTMNPSLYHMRMEDFDLYTAAQWVVGGVGAPVAPVLVSGDGGIISLTNSAADNDNNFISPAQPGYILQAGKKMFFRAHFTPSVALQIDLALGLQIPVAANNFLTPANGIFFRKDDDQTGIVLVSRAAGVETVSASLGALVDNTQTVVSLYYDGQSTLYGQLNVATSAGAVPPIVFGAATLVSITPAAFPTVALGMVAGVQNGDGNARVLTIDYLMAAKER